MKYSVKSQTNVKPSCYYYSIQSHYYAFGSPMAGRTHSQENYRFGFNGQERDDDVSGTGNMISFQFRISDSRLGRFLSIDPLYKNYPFFTPYQFASNQPVHGKELEGLENENTKGSTQQSRGISGHSNDGYNNPAGASGPAGPAGISGPVGPAGVPGVAGPVGPTGATSSNSTKSNNKIVFNPIPDEVTIKTSITINESSNTEANVAPLVLFAEGTSTINPVGAAAGLGALTGTLLYKALNPPETRTRDYYVTIPREIPDNEQPITLYRGVTYTHPAYPIALTGTAIPLGFLPENIKNPFVHANPNFHNDDNTLSIFTSWTTSRQVACNWATVSGKGGIVLTKQFYLSETVPSPDNWNECEILIPGIVTGAEVSSPGAPYKK